MLKSTTVFSSCCELITHFNIEYLQCFTVRTVERNRNIFLLTEVASIICKTRLFWSVLMPSMVSLTLLWSKILQTTNVLYDFFFFYIYTDGPGLCEIDPRLILRLSPPARCHFHLREKNILEPSWQLSLKWKKKCIYAIKVESLL